MGRKGRTVAIPQWAVAELRALKAEQAERRLQMAEGYRADLDLFCALEDGAPIKPNTCSWAFRDLMEDLDIRQVTFHDLRHTHASHLLNDGESLAVIQQRLGHSSITTTIDRYGHLDEGQQRQAADRLDRLMGSGT